MAAIFMASCYQAELRFASEQTGIVRGIERLLFREEPEVGKGAAEHGGKYEGGGMNFEGLHYE